MVMESNMTEAGGSGGVGSLAWLGFFYIYIYMYVRGDGGRTGEATETFSRKKRIF